MGDRKIARVRHAPVTKQVDTDEINELIAKSSQLDPDDTRTREMDPAVFRALLREQRGGQPTPPVPEIIVAEPPPPEIIVAEPLVAPDQPDEPWLALAMSPPLEEPRAPISKGLVVALVLAIAAALAIVLFR